MSEMFQIIVLMAVPVAILLGLRRMVICQNRRFDAQARAVRLAGAEPNLSAATWTESALRWPVSR